MGSYNVYGTRSDSPCKNEQRIATGQTADSPEHARKLIERHMRTVKVTRVEDVTRPPVSDEEARASKNRANAALSNAMSRRFQVSRRSTSKG